MEKSGKSAVFKLDQNLRKIYRFEINTIFCKQTYSALWRGK